MKIIQIPDFSAARVLVVGDLMLDRYWHGDTSRISPEAPVPVVRVGEVEERAGGAGNVALNVAALGASAAVVGLTGDDEAADALACALENHEVTCHFERLAGFPTVTKLRVLSRHQQLIRLDFEDGFPGYDASGLLDRFSAELEQCDVVVLSDYQKGALRQAGEMIAIARTAGKPVVVDPKGSDFSCYAGASLITPNMSEFEGVVGHCANDEEVVVKGEQLRRQLRLDALLITRSEKGMTLLQENAEPLHIPTKAREVFDVTGAGDTVVSVLAAALAAGQGLVESTVLANLAAGVVVGKLGTATASVPELRRAMREQDEMEQGMVDEDKLVALVQEAKAHGETVVMTNGCFDILHAGHVTYLEEAARLGDRLIVAVNDDASVKRLKGEERPVNTQERRMRVLAALDCVDWVVGFDEDTPTRLICRVLPDILVKGGDNEPDKIPGGECVREAGGRVEVMSYVDNVSTTGIIGAIRASEKKSGGE
ncbi:MAG: bifunctional D-glycero-beta-D-manno-heptose-7-phosphate kinase/D-glycero-beta-D-manno-heptose 1-phosphate adenylyltransferase HldE [Gammaproteobacteria bacterium]|nr:bifunctional D-glycero-beta-D-manno-heptose-7-phosphate kinase/D-glycero-beta-D-manno-heptose 1-phosphate adenylyltransferase HldE [Gammaproteobacteria bacterium]MCW8840743.1 bifunctional D-glycero-beta-D-manno-heptose-7-phosphate kinase/D-glycero-beta-D-manno-heptose 1-phosphate adenylyltransferase HldE [Gammaproteobacteria bacterium]MCW8959530.1 bifunctional D-glycero-beta-D-manno-heptose-7-phosphate kinase/D-glycero-beta-D-manno-heptose 1-phosphate adenylyltransferase HldE [Gammaproteobacte